MSSGKTKFFLDTEFIEDGKTIDLLSIGMVCDNGHEFYAVSGEADQTKANAFVRNNVLPHLLVSPEGYHEKLITPKSRHGILIDVVEFVSRNTQQADKPSFYSYYADYDWVAFCQLFGCMIDLPKGWPMYCRDIKQVADMLGNPDLPKPEKDIHHALLDARNIRAGYEFLLNYIGQRQESPLGAVLSI